MSEDLHRAEMDRRVVGDTAVKLEYLRSVVDKLELKLDQLPKNLQDQFVGRYEFEALHDKVAELDRTAVKEAVFEPYRTLLRGMVGTALLAIISAILALVILSR